MPLHPRHKWWLRKTPPRKSKSTSSLTGQDALPPASKACPERSRRDAGATLKPARTAREGQPANGYTVFATARCLPEKHRPPWPLCLASVALAVARDAFSPIPSSGASQNAPTLSVCDLKFQREEGYFLGAMYISFGLALMTIALIAGCCGPLPDGGSPEGRHLGGDTVLTARSSHLIFARVLWIYMDQAFDPERPENVGASDPLVQESGCGLPPGEGEPHDSRRDSGATKPLSGPRRVECAACGWRGTACS